MTSLTLRYTNVGAFQFYGLGVDNMIIGMSMKRGGGFANWGQERGTFVNPNLMNQVTGNTVLEGLRAEHQGTPLGMGGWGDALQFSGLSRLSLSCASRSLSCVCMPPHAQHCRLP